MNRGVLSKTVGIMLEWGRAKAEWVKVLWAAKGQQEGSREDSEAIRRALKGRQRNSKDKFWPPKSLYNS